MTIERRTVIVETFNVFTTGKKCTRKKGKDCDAFKSAFLTRYVHDGCSLFACTIHDEQRADIGQEYLKKKPLVENGRHKIARTMEA